MKYIKSCRIKWLSHVEIMDEERIPKCVMLERMKGTRKRGGPRSRLLDEVKKDLQQMGIRNWRNFAKERDKWRRIVLEAKGHYSL